MHGVGRRRIDRDGAGEGRTDSSQRVPYTSNIHARHVLRPAARSAVCRACAIDHLHDVVRLRRGGWQRCYSVFGKLAALAERKRRASKPRERCPTK